MKQFVSFIRKEFYHIFRDMRTTLMLLLMPVILIILFGFAISTEIRRSPIAVWDQRHDDSSGKLINQLQASEYFELYQMINSREEAGELFRRGKIRLALIIPPAQADARVQILADATDPNEANLLIRYAGAVMTSSLPGPSLREEVSGEVLLLYNPQMKGAYNFVPGVMGLILMLICAMMTSVGIVKEKELGTMEVLLVSPLRPVYIILAKAAPYLLISMVNIATILLLSRFLLDVPIRGSLVVLVSLSVLYALVALCLGLLISTLADTQQAAMLISGVVLMLPTVLLSGMVFPVENMPWILRRLSDIVPAKWYIIGVKDVMIKGLEAGAILRETGILALMAIVLTGLSVKRFKIRL
ncbi:MAG: ABC transporter permease [Tannerellaceae bacterium]|jgi:ABC-2 type transport system permease protein|nr:ABC transporter permease [Tannerellaceae bacterium]